MFRPKNDGEGLALGVLLLVLLFALLAYRTPQTGPLRYYELYVPVPMDQGPVGFAVAQLDAELWTHRARRGVDASLGLLAGTETSSTGEGPRR